MRTILSTMRRIKRLIQVMMAAVVVAGSSILRLPAVKAYAADKPSLIISQFKITGSDGQFVILYNATDSALDMGKYRLEYFNNADPGQATGGKLVTLSGTVPPHGYFMVNDDALLLCYQLTLDSVSLGFSSTSGTVEVLESGDTAAGIQAPILQDYVSWSKKAVVNAQTLPAGDTASLRRQPDDSEGAPIINLPGSGSWQIVRPAVDNACGLVTETGVPVSPPPGLSNLLPSGEPPASLLSDAVRGAVVPALPTADVGLRAPSVTELLPNPPGTGNDSTDEFIELYNPNSQPFDLSGFSLQAGTTSLHTFTFPAGTNLPARGFKAFYSATTGLSLSNSGGQVKLLDPLGNDIANSAVYETAKDGIAWALAHSKWYWTTDATPGRANIVKQPLTNKKTKVKNGSSKKQATTNTQSTAAMAGSNGNDSEAPVSPIHLRTLVLVAGLAILYGAYEYRADLANRIYRLRRNFGTRHEDRA